MIGRVRGILLEKQPPDILVEVGGIAYELQASMQTFYQLPEIGSEVTLYTHFVVREDAQQLFAFFLRDERHLFRFLIKVNGVGSKLALTILSGIPPDEFVHCIMDNNTERLVRLPGVGKKTAERLIIEMRDRLAGWQSNETGGLPETMAQPKTRLQQDAISALVALGYKPQEANRVLKNIPIENMTVESLIHQALKRMN